MSTDNSDKVEEGPRQPRKRRRVPIACNFCRARKSRCDGDSPKCSLCREMGVECAYLRTHHPRVPDDARPGELQELRDRLQALERVVENAATRRPSTESYVAGATPFSPNGLTQYSPSGTAQYAAKPPHPGPAPSASPAQGLYASTIGTGVSPSDVVSAPPPADGMGAVILDNEEMLTFYGPSSNITFTRHITQMVARLGHIANPWSTPNNGAASFLATQNTPSSPPDYRKPHRAETVDNFALPPEVEMDRLVDCYFSDIGLLFPYLHKLSFLDSYGQLKMRGSRNVRTIWLGIFNMVLAMASISLKEKKSEAQSWDEDSQIFYQRAVGLCDAAVLSSTSIEVVQYLLLVMQYHQAAQSSVQTTNAFGLAVSTAMRIGLHSRQTSESFPPLEKEIRNRVWYLCIIFDRVLSMTLGRPAAIPYSYVKVDLPRNIEVMEPSMSASDKIMDYSIGVFIATIKLYQIMWKVIDQQYGQNLGFEKSPSVVDIISPISGLDNEMREWDRTLPNELKLVTYSQLDTLLASYDPKHPSAKAKRFQVVLTMRYLNLTLLLHRPVLVKYFELASSTTEMDMLELNLLNKLGRNSINVCFACSIEIISLVGRLVQNTGPIRDLLNVWWFALYYTFNAGLVLAGLILTCHFPSLGIIDPPPRAACIEGLEKAVVALAHLDKGNRIVERCHDYLRRLTGVLERLTFEYSEFPLPTPTGPVPFIDDPANQVLSTQDLMFLQSHTMSRDETRNYGDMMTGDDLGFLNFYFSPNGGLATGDAMPNYPGEA